MVYDIEFENMYSFKEKVVFSMEGTETNAKNQNYYRINDSGKCLKVGVIYGANASGKTNLIRCLSWLHDLLIVNAILKEEDGFNGLGLAPFGLTETTMKAPTSFKIRLYHRDGFLYTYKLKINAKEVLDESLSKFVEGEDIILFRRIYAESNKHTIVLDDGIKDFALQQDKVRKNQIAITYLQAVNVPVVSEIAYELLSIQMTNSYNLGMTQALWINAKMLLSKDNGYREKLIQFLKHLDTGFKDFRMPNENS